MRHDQRGAAMVVVALAMALLLLLTGLALDFGRARLLQAQLQTAVDAGALAGALHVATMVSVEADRWLAVEEWCADPVSGHPSPCLTWEQVNPATAAGPWSEVMGTVGWRRATAAQCAWPHRCAEEVRVVQEWQVLQPTTEQAAREALLLNATWPGGARGATLEAVVVEADPETMAVSASATLKVPTHFLRLVGIDELRLTRSAAASPVRRLDGPVVAVRNHRWGSNLID